MKIPFCKPYITSDEYKFIKEALDNHMLSGDKKWTKLCSVLLEETVHAKKAFLTTSCSTALDMTAFLLNLKIGDEVIMPSFNFVSMANSVVSRGAVPLFADIDEKTLTIDLKDVENKITSRTKAIYPVHYAGISCDMDELEKIATQANVMVVEDAAQAVNAKYKGRYLGTIGDMGCYSFHETKNYTCGEGGALLINDADTALSERAEIIREKGTNRTQFFRGEVDKYTWVDVGSSYLPSDLLAAMLYAQLRNFDENLKLRKQAFDIYFQLLQPLSDRSCFRLPYVPEYAQPNYHIFYLILSSEKDRNGLMEFLRKEGISACFHYVPLHSSPAGRKFTNRFYHLPVTDRISSRLLRLPLYCTLGEKDISFIVRKIEKYFC